MEILQDMLDNLGTGNDDDEGESTRVVKGGSEVVIVLDAVEYF